MSSSISSYYSISAILTDAQTLPCTFTLDVPGLGHLDNNSTPDLKKDTTLELPLWLAEMLAISTNLGTPTPLTTLSLPPALSTRVLSALSANPLTIDLRAQAPYFYGLAARVLELFDEEGLVEILTETYKKRAGEIADQALNSRGGGQGEGEFLRGLDEEERGLFRAAHDSAKRMRVWMGEMKKK